MDERNALIEGSRPLHVAAKHGMPDSYWQARNALVDAVTAIETKIGGKSVFELGGWDLPGAAELRDQYRRALDELRAFDAQHDGAPVQ
jgi:hypothetical protein